MASSALVRSTANALYNDFESRYLQNNKVFNNTDFIAFKRLAKKKLSLVDEIVGRRILHTIENDTTFTVYNGPKEKLQTFIDNGARERVQWVANQLGQEESEYQIGFAEGFFALVVASFITPEMAIGIGALLIIAHCMQDEESVETPPTDKNTPIISAGEIHPLEYTYDDAK